MGIHSIVCVSCDVFHRIALFGMAGGKHTALIGEGVLRLCILLPPLLSFYFHKSHSHQCVVESAMVYMALIYCAVGMSTPVYVNW